MFDGFLTLVESFVCLDLRFNIKWFWHMLVPRFVCGIVMVLVIVVFVGGFLTLIKFLWFKLQGRTV